MLLTARLETRTKESMELAGSLVSYKPFEGMVKATYTQMVQPLPVVPSLTAGRSPWMMVRPLPVSGSVSLCLRGERSLGTVVPKRLWAVWALVMVGAICASQWIWRMA